MEVFCWDGEKGSGNKVESVGGGVLWKGKSGGLVDIVSGKIRFERVERKSGGGVRRWKSFAEVE